MECRDISQETALHQGFLIADHPSPTMRHLDNLDFEPLQT